MKKLVSPEHVVYFVSSREELKDLVRRLRIDEKLVGNLRQLYDSFVAGRRLATGTRPAAILTRCSPTSAPVK
jgi:hypothetical protein